MTCGCKVVVNAAFADLDPPILYCYKHESNAIDHAERRRYALLHAAASIFPLISSSQYVDPEDEVSAAVRVAIALLAEIEKESHD